MLLGEEGSTGRAVECRLVCGNAFYVFAFTPGAVDQLLGAFQKKRHCGLVFPPMSSAVGDMRITAAGYASLK